MLLLGHIVALCIDTLDGDADTRVILADLLAEVGRERPGQLARLDETIEPDMPRPAPVVLPMSVDEFDHMDPWLGWKHEYWDGAARLSVSSTAIASFERAIDPPDDHDGSAPADVQIRPIELKDRDELVELFLAAFDDSVEFAGYPDDAYRREAVDSVESFFGRPTSRKSHSRSCGRLDASFVATPSGLIPATYGQGTRLDSDCDVGSGSLAEQPHGALMAAVFVRSIRRGPILEPIMVHPSCQRRGLGIALLCAALKALCDVGESDLFSRCHLGNAASFAWHDKHGFEEIAEYFSASHRWRHYAWRAKHFHSTGQLDRAAEMEAVADRWKEVVKELEDSENRWRSSLLN